METMAPFLPLFEKTPCDVGILVIGLTQGGQPDQQSEGADAG